MILCLIHNTEKLDDSIDDLVHICYTDEILYNMYQFKQNVQSVIVTKKYIDKIGYKKTADAIKALYFLRPVKIIYVSYEPSLDIFVRELASLNLSTINANLSSITKDKYIKLLQKDMEFSLTDISDKLSIEIEEIIQNFKLHSEEDRENFVILNKDNIIKGLESLSVISDENKNLLQINKDNESKIEVLNSLEKHRLKELNVSLKQNSELKKLNKEWYNFYLNVTDDFNNYNHLYKINTVITNHNEKLKIIYYNEKLKIIYFKEIEDINFTRIFNEIYERFNLTKYTKALIIDDNQFRDYSSLGFNSIPSEITVSDLAETNKMVRYSNPKTALQKICSKSFRVEVLLVLDRTHNPLPHIENANTFYLGNYKNTYKDIEIDDSAFISPYEGEWSCLKELLIPIGDNSINSKAFTRISRANKFTNYLCDLVNYG